MATRPGRPAKGERTTAPAPRTRRAAGDTLSGELFAADDAAAAPPRAASSPPPPGPPAPPRPAAGGGGGDESLPLARFAERSYLEYAMSVVTGRALPDVADGQKPVQRRILYAMHELGLYAPARHVKSARVVGDVLGKYHPHGDTAAYDALVRQAQDFTLRYPLIDGQGNFGSRDGDNAAAMRYTECRLTPIAELLLAEIERDTVDFGPNYDGSFREPKLLPARLPVLLLNGASGIGVGMATDVPPHNLAEVAQAVVATIRNPAITLDELLALVPGPDLPGGGHVTSDRDAIRAVYESGRGSLRVRARWTVEDLARGQWQVAVTELPHGVSARAVLEDIERATNPRPKEGKKSLSQEQLNLRNLMLGALDTVRDESDKDAPVRLVLEPRSSRQDPGEFMQLLLANTRLEASLPVNLVMLGRDGRPRSKDFKQILGEWIAFRFDTVARRTRHRLGEVDRRIHILDGRALALLNIDRVIRIIRKADDPKAELIAAFGLTDVQADDILEIRLRQLARLEAIRIETELKALRSERKGLAKVLGDRKALADLIVAEVEADAERYGDRRRTLIEAVAPVALARTVPDEPLTVTLSRNGWIRSRQGHGLDAAQFGWKAGDAPLAILETRTIHPVVLLDTAGRAYTIRAADIPGGRGDGVPVTTLVELQPGARVVQALSSPPGRKYLVAGTGGYGFVASIDDMLSRQRGGKAFMTLEPGEEPVAPVPLAEGLDHVATLASNGKLLVFPVAEMREVPRGRGVIMMRLDDGQSLLAVALVPPTRVAVRGANRVGRVVDVVLEGDALAKHLLPRARKGALVASKLRIAGFPPG
ncbi:MAG: DNA topoisomerase 4 subunit A [Betaproteobacteria bacterium]|nr:MAG: DNA topoisomerase 4 subunit A [Betaproteobacteria bacterium]